MDSEFPEDKIGTFSDGISRRANREPLQHITGQAPFRHLELAVGKGVFTPRPETEQVVSFAMEKIASFENPVIVDLCAGSGAIALSFATERPDATVYAVEKSQEAFEFLKQNSNKYGLALGQLSNLDLQDCLTEMESVADLVISNPPYIPNGSIPVDLEVQLHEPAISLYGGVDGLDVIRQILSKAKQLLRTGEDRKTTVEETRLLDVKIKEVKNGQRRQKDQIVKVIRGLERVVEDMHRTKEYVEKIRYGQERVHSTHSA
jgi:release factor glutamine methyltransferase